MAAGPANIFEYNEALGDADRSLRVSHRRQFAWLARSGGFAELPATLFKPRKVLGRGAYGICGLWEYRYRFGKPTNLPRSVVVKQCTGPMAKLLAEESAFLHLMASCNTDHIVKLLKGCHRGQGTGADPKWDPLPFNDRGNYAPTQEVARIYLEYLPGGDVKDLGDEIWKVENFMVPEEHLWRMLHCFAKACMVLEYGTEDPNAPPATVTTLGTPNVTSPWRPVCHFDIKPANILIGGRDVSGRDAAEHSRLEVFKLADLGISRFAPLTTAERQDEDWIKGTQWRASNAWMSPEQFYPDHVNRDIGSATNIWCIGAIIRELITEKDLPVTTSFMHRVDEGRPPIRIHGSPDELLDSTFCQYTAVFINTICKCLAIDPAERISPEDLLSQTTEILEAYDNIPDRADPDPKSLLDENFIGNNIPPPGFDDAAFDPGTNKTIVPHPDKPDDAPPDDPENPWLPRYRGRNIGGGVPDPNDVNAFVLKFNAQATRPKRVAKQKNFQYRYLSTSPGVTAPDPNRGATKRRRKSAGARAYRGKKQKKTI